MSKPCLEPGCPRLAASGKSRCPPCNRVWARPRERARNALPHRQAYRDPVYQSIPIGGICHLCGEPGADTRDHVKPLIEGGTNDPVNIKPAHRACNSSKADKPDR